MEAAPLALTDRPDDSREETSTAREVYQGHVWWPLRHASLTAATCSFNNAQVVASLCRI
jgi:hypothetical protein